MKICDLYYVTFNHSFLPLCHITSTPAIQSLSDIFRTPLQGQNAISIWIIPKLSFMSSCINKVLLPTQTQSFFKFSLVSLIHFSYSHTIWQKDVFSTFCSSLQFDPPCFSCVRFSDFVLCICPRYFHLLQKRLARVFKPSTRSLLLIPLNI